jgi:ABC-type sugar transport system ATPase subunit
MVLSSMRRFSRLLFTRDRQEIRTAEDFIGKLKIRTTGCRQQVQDLSGETSRRWSWPDA